MGVIWENGGAETIAGIVVGSTLTFAVGCRPISDPFTEELAFKVGPGTVAAGVMSIFVMVWFGTRFPGKEWLRAVRASMKLSDNKTRKCGFFA
jgi:hypothetical protein